MTIALVGVEVRSDRRLRLTFSTALAAGAFGSPPYYVVTSRAIDTTAPTVMAALIVSGDPAAVELALSNDLVRGSLYDISAVGVPAADTSTTPNPTTSSFQFGTKISKTGIEPYIRDLERVVYQADIVWNGSDYEETATGDLARIEGPANVTKALWRGVDTVGLPWDPSWGLNSREWVDSPSPAGTTLRGALLRQITRDPRVKSVTVSIDQTGNQTFINIYPTLRTGVTLAPVSTPVNAT